MSSRLDELIAKAKAKHDIKSTFNDSKVRQKSAPTYQPHRTKVESRTAETNMFDNLEDCIDGLDNTLIPPESDFAPDGLQVGDPVVGIHKGQRLAGQVIDINGDYATVEWKNHDISSVKVDELELSNVDDDYEEETMYIESVQPNMGFDKEAFVEDTDLKSLLTGRDYESESNNGMGFKYGDIDDL